MIASLIHIQQWRIQHTAVTSLNCVRYNKINIIWQHVWHWYCQPSKQNVTLGLRLGWHSALGLTISMSHMLPYDIYILLYLTFVYNGKIPLPEKEIFWLSETFSTFLTRDQAKIDCQVMWPQWYFECHIRANNCFNILAKSWRDCLPYTHTAVTHTAYSSDVT